jgi:hypothetical protein
VTEGLSMLEEHRCFGLIQGVYRHESSVTGGAGRPGARVKTSLLNDQGTADPFLEDQLKP